MRITINGICLRTDPRVTIYRVELISDEGVWPETFGSEHELRIYLRGIKVAMHMAGRHDWVEPEIPEPEYGPLVSFP